MANIKQTINRLLLALQSKGIILKINTQQFYSEQQERVCTKMILWEDSPKDGEVFYSCAELLKALAERWKEVSDYEGKQEAR